MPGLAVHPLAHFTGPAGKRQRAATGAGNRGGRVAAIGVNGRLRAMVQRPFDDFERIHGELDLQQLLPDFLLLAAQEDEVVHMCVRRPRQKGHTEIYRGTEYAVAFLPKLKIEVAVSSESADAAIEAISSAAKTGQIGDGKIFVCDLEQVMRIRTGETGADAL